MNGKYPTAIAVSKDLMALTEALKEIFEILEDEGYDAELLGKARKAFAEGIFAIHVATAFYLFGRSPIALAFLARNGVHSEPTDDGPLQLSFANSQ